ncbi:hypothetical protein C4553_00385 [Candidatus Parcubacteria bacterium]|nr:MAG: hypothetical protein C4553_00385 [Candidatus Parcubacteria bacterium]
MNIKKPILFFQEVLMVSLSVFLGIVVASRLRESFLYEKVYSQELSATTVFLYIIIATIVILILSKAFRKFGNFSFQAIFILAVFGGLNIFFSIFFIPILALVLATAFTVYRMVHPTVINHNLVIILSVAGVGGSLGLSLSPIAVVSLLIMLSVYDFIAVYKTKHMVHLAEEMIRSRAILGLIIPESLRAHGQRTHQAKPGEGFMFLGGGDVVMPTIFAVSVLPVSIYISLVIWLSSLLGFFVNHLFFTNQTERKPMPALPMIAVFSIAGYFTYQLIAFLIWAAYNNGSF